MKQFTSRHRGREAVQRSTATKTLALNKANYAQIYRVKCVFKWHTTEEQLIGSGKSSTQPVSALRRLLVIGTLLSCRHRGRKTLRLTHWHLHRIFVYAAQISLQRRPKRVMSKASVGRSFCFRASEKNARYLLSIIQHVPGVDYRKLVMVFECLWMRVCAWKKCRVFRTNISWILRLIWL